MTVAHCSVRSEVEARARRSLGGSSAAIYQMVARVLESRHAGNGVLVDVGCGEGRLWPFLRQQFDSYVGIDAVRYHEFPSEAEFRQADLDSGIVSLPDESADVVAAVEIIEHLENPRALMREIIRLVKPGGWLLVTTPNQLSLLSLLTLVIKKRFSAFQDVHYPAHLTALLEVDLRRMASECGLNEVSIEYSEQGRIVFTPWHYPAPVSRLFPRALSDNLLLIGRKCVG